MSTATTPRLVFPLVDAAPTDQRARGALLIQDRVVRRTAERAVELSEVGASTTGVEVTSAEGEPIRLRIAVDVVYPDVPLTEVLDSLRRRVSRQLSASLGRDVERIDIRVDSLVQDQPRLPRLPRVL